MRNVNKKLALTAAVAALAGALGAAVAQTPTDEDPRSTVTTSTPASTDVNGNHIMRFRDEGNSPETDPSAHLLLIKHGAGPQVAATEQQTTVAQAEPQSDTMPAPAASSDSSSMAAPSSDATSDTTVGGTEQAAMPAPRADRN